MSGQDENRKSGNTTSESSPTLLEMIVKSESSESRQLRKKIEEGSEHPSEELLQAYATLQLPREGARSVMKHLALCAPCAKKALSLAFQQEDLPDAAYDAASQPSWLDRLKEVVSEFSFPVIIQTPALGAMRGNEAKDSTRVVKVGDPLVLSIRPPETGNVVIFHYVEKGDEARLVFPDRPSDVTRVLAGEDVRIIEGEIEEPEGVQEFKIIWTKDMLIDPKAVQWDDPAAVDAAVEGIFHKLEELTVDKDWQETICKYEVENA